MIEKFKHYLDKFAEHEQRPDVAGEHPLGDFFQGLFFLLFLAVTITDRLFIKTHTLIYPFFPLWARILAATFIFILAWKLAVGGLRTVFGDIREKPVVINDDAFSQSRHPIYLGAILLYLALVVLSLSLIGAALWIIIILYYHYLARYEEKLMIKKFGEDYRKYMQQVPMWLPRPRISKRS